MKDQFIKIIEITFVCCVFSCTHQTKKKEQPVAVFDNKTKPPSSFSDTLKITSRSAVFYYADSVQLEKIKTITEKNIFDGSMHEYFYQLRSAHIVLKDRWPEIKIIEAKNVRWLQFVKADLTNEYIDLDKKNDAYGLFVFDPLKSPSQLELTNAESEIGFYFSTNKPLKQKRS